MSVTLEPDLSTRDRIANEAAALFAERGFSGVSMRDIADAAGIKAASLYNHFADKEELYFGALESGFAERISGIEASLGTQGCPETRLRATVLALARVSAEDTVSRKLLHRELLDGDGDRLERLTRSLFKAPYDRMTRLFGELAPDGDGATTTAYINALITGYFLLVPVMQLLDQSLSDDPQVVGDQIADLLIASMKQGVV